MVVVNRSSFCSATNPMSFSEDILKMSITVVGDKIIPQHQQCPCEYQLMRLTQCFCSLIQILASSKSHTNLFATFKAPQVVAMQPLRGWSTSNIAILPTLYLSPSTPPQPLSIPMSLVSGPCRSSCTSWAPACSLGHFIMNGWGGKEAMTTLNMQWYWLTEGGGLCIVGSRLVRRSSRKQHWFKNYSPPGSLNRFIILYIYIFYLFFFGS